MCKVSIIIPVYNGEKYLTTAVESIRNQTLEDLEIILINDGSTDKSGEICDYYSEIDKRVIVVHQSNQGVSAARNKGIEIAKGEYIGFLDSDDYVEKETFYTLVKKAEEYEADIVTCYTSVDYTNRSIVTSNNRYERVLTPEEAIIEINYERDLTPGIGDKIFRKCLFQNIKIPVNVPIGEDHSMNCFLVTKANKVVIVPKAFMHYVQRSESVSHKGGSFFVDKMYNTFYNHKKTADLIVGMYPNAEKSIIAKLVFQEMSVVISMVRANHYEKELAHIITKDIRKYLSGYLKDKEVERYKKICAILVSMHYRCLTVPYKLFIDKVRMRGLK